MLCGVFAQEDAPCDVNMDEGSDSGTCNPGDSETLAVDPIGLQCEIVTCKYGSRPLNRWLYPMCAAPAGTINNHTKFHECLLEEDDGCFNRRCQSLYSCAIGISLNVLKGKADTDDNADEAFKDCYYADDDDDRRRNLLQDEEEEVPTIVEFSEALESIEDSSLAWAVSSAAVVRANIDYQAPISLFKATYKLNLCREQGPTYCQVAGAYKLDGDWVIPEDTVLGTTVPVCDAPTLLHFPAFYELPNGVANVSFAYKCSETIKIGPFSSVNIARIAAAGTGEFCRVSAD